jgi:predicted Rossmann fold nucleotide-binding protein DprA/Smf involved in DNA uptake
MTEIARCARDSERRLQQEYVTSPPRCVRPWLDKAGEMLLDALGFEPVDADTLVTRTGSPAQTVSSLLPMPELKGQVAPHAGRYCRFGPGLRKGRAQ